MRGGERVLEQICQLFPQADIFTHVLRADRISADLLRHNIRETSVGKLPFADRLYTNYLAFMPKALEELNLADYDLVISSEAGPAKGVIPSPNARHICYCHSPMRYIWDQYYLYSERLNWPKNAIFSNVAHKLRSWDVASAARVDTFIANSHFVAQRIERYYRRTSQVLHPPVDLAAYTMSPAPARNYYLLVSQLVPYKRTEIAIEAFRNLDRQLVIIGDGPKMQELRRKAPKNVRFLGRTPQSEMNHWYANCRALIFPVEEDFGIVPLEAMAAGRPVIALKRGGAMETVVANRTGLFFDHQTADCLREAIENFERQEESFRPEDIRKHAERFSEEAFRAGFSRIVAETLNTRSR
jgi:glycosyltransferase involved in cell wall biosynthesis